MGLSRLTGVSVRVCICSTYRVCLAQGLIVSVGLRLQSRLCQTGHDHAKGWPSDPQYPSHIKWSLIFQSQVILNIPVTLSDPQYPSHIKWSLIFQSQVILNIPVTLSGP